jgi:hypothetical protein
LALPDLYADADLELAIGSAANLVQLCRASSVADPAYAAFKAQVRRAAQGDLYSMIEPSVVISDANVAISDFIQAQALPIAVYWAYHKGSAGQTIPEPAKAAYADARAALVEFREGTRSLGTQTEGARSAAAHQVDMDASGTSGNPGSGWTRGNFGGYC